EILEALEKEAPEPRPAPGKADREEEAEEILEALEKAPPQQTPPPGKAAKEEEADEVFEALDKGPADSDIFSDSSAETEALSAKGGKAPAPTSPVPRKTGRKDKTDLKEEMKLGDFDDKRPAKKKTGADEVTEEIEEAEEDDDRPRGKKPAPPKMRRPKRLRHWVGGFFLALFLLAGGAAAVWFLKPDLIYEQALPAL